MGPVARMILLAGMVLTACTAPAGASRPSVQQITVAAASDLQRAFGELGRLYEQETGRKAVFVFGSSGTLAKQIEQGAPFDVFAAANVQFVDDLRAKGRVIAETQQLYAVGRIVLAYNTRADLRLRDLTDLARADVRWVALANPEHAPYGMAAKQALEAAGVWEQVKPKLVFGENVSQALQFVQSGNADAGIVALSIADVPEIGYLLVDQDLHAPLKQSMAVVAGTRQEHAAREFLAFVNGPKGRPIMRKYGFLMSGEG